MVILVIGGSFLLALVATATSDVWPEVISELAEEARNRVAMWRWKRKAWPKRIGR